MTMGLLDPAVPKDSTKRAVLTGGVATKWRKDFTDPTLPSWDITNGASSGGADWTVNPATGVVTVGMGVTPGADYTLVSKQGFYLPLQLQVGIQISQKIAQNEIYVELVGVQADGVTLDETVVAAWRIAGSDSTTTTVARTEVRNGHTARLQSGNLTVLAETTSQILEIQAKTETIVFSYKAADTSAASSIAQVRNSNALDPNQLYKLRLRCRNGGSAPASNTTVTFSFASLVDFVEQRVEVSGGAGNASLNQAIPVNVVATTTPASPALSASATVTGVNVAKINSAATANPLNLKTTAARLYGYDLVNTHATNWAFVKLHNLSTTPVAGTSAVADIIAIPPGQPARLTFPAPISFGTGLGYTIVGGTGLDADTTAVLAQQVIGALFWV